MNLVYLFVKFISPLELLTPSWASPSCQLTVTWKCSQRISIYYYVIIIFTWGGNSQETKENCPREHRFENIVVPLAQELFVLLVLSTTTTTKGNFLPRPYFTNFRTGTPGTRLSIFILRKFVSCDPTQLFQLLPADVSQGDHETFLLPGKWTSTVEWQTDTVLPLDNNKVWTATFHHHSTPNYSSINFIIQVTIHRDTEIEIASKLDWLEMARTRHRLWK